LMNLLNYLLNYKMQMKVNCLNRVRGFFKVKPNQMFYNIKYVGTTYNSLNLNQ